MVASSYSCKKIEHMNFEVDIPSLNLIRVPAFISAADTLCGARVALC